MANPYFNAALYLGRNPDLAIAGFTVDNVEQHYLQYGAAESVSNANRLPNNWFNPQFYLLSNPDLVQAGLGYADALAHFAQYGVTEGRVFSSNPALNPSNFNAQAYATANKDVATALGITDVTAITPVQAGELMGHYLAYGAGEGRAGTGTFQVVAGSNITVSNGDVTVGTTTDDTFLWANADASFAANVNGLTGVDTLKIGNLSANSAATVASIEKIVVDSVTNVAGATLTVTGSGVESLTVTNANAFTYAGAKVGSLTLKGVAAVTTQFTGVTGSSDALEVTTAFAGAQTLNTNGIEQLSIKVGETSTGLTLNANSVQGSSLTATLTGGKAAVNNAFTLDSAASGDLSTVTIDGSAALGNQTLSLGAGIETIAGLNVTIKGGAGTDTLNANVGIDTLTGGAGKDTFAFSAAEAVARLDTSGKITAVDKITDFTKNAVDSALNDVITVATMTQATAGAVGTIGDVDAKGLITFDTNYLAGKTLTDVVTDLTGIAAIANDGLIFSFGGSTYVYMQNATVAGIADDALIELVGVDATQITTAAGGGVAFV